MPNTKEEAIDFYAYGAAMQALTDKQRCFVLKYVELGCKKPDLAYKACIEAGLSKTPIDNPNLSQRGTDMLRVPKVQVALEEYREQLSGHKRIPPSELLGILHDIIIDGGLEQLIDDKGNIDLKKVKDGSARNLLSSISVSESNGPDGSSSKSVSVKGFDKMGAIKLYTQIMGYDQGRLQNKTEVNVQVLVPVFGSGGAVDDVDQFNELAKGDDHER